MAQMHMGMFIENVAMPAAPCDFSIRADRSGLTPGARVNASVRLRSVMKRATKKEGTKMRNQSNHRALAAIKNPDPHRRPSINYSAKQGRRRRVGYSCCM